MALVKQYVGLHPHRHIRPALKIIDFHLTAQVLCQDLFSHTAPPPPPPPKKKSLL